MIKKCDKCKKYVGFFNIKEGLCKQCRENGNVLLDNINNFLSKQPFIFKSNKGAFEYACEYLDCSLHEDATLPAIVLSEPSRKELGIDYSEGNNDIFIINVASHDGGFTVLAETANNTNIKLKPGDLVSWQAGKLIPDLGKKIFGDIRCGWVGFIFSTLKPELTDKGWTYDKAL